MKFLYRTSLFFVTACAFFTIGIFAKDGIKQLKAEKEEIQEVQETQYQETSVKKNVVTGDTVYEIEAYQLQDETNQVYEEAIPPKLIGLTRERVEEEIAVYSYSPSLEDLEKGFVSSELISFSPQKIVVRKNYQALEEEEIPEFFYLMVENNYITVYKSDLKTVYQKTDILMEHLPTELQKEIMDMKYIESETELYNFLESYSS